MIDRASRWGWAFVLSVAGVLGPAGCSEESSPAKKEAKSESPKENPAAQAVPATPSEKPGPELDPTHELYRKQAPAEYRVRFLTTKGEFDIKVTRAWSPAGADRFYALVKAGFYNDTRIFRVMPDFMAQFGINGNPKVSELWEHATIPDDPARESNTRGMITFATSGPNSRTTQVFINFKDKNAFLDSQGFTPFGKVTEGMEVVDSITAEYGESPNQQMITRSGNAYLDANYPNLDRVKSIRILE